MTEVERLQNEIKELEAQNGKRNIYIATGAVLGGVVGFLATRKSGTTIKITGTIASALVIGGVFWFVTKKKATNRNEQIATKKQAITNLQKPLFNPSVIPAPEPAPKPKAFPTDKGIKPELNVDVNKNGIPDYLESKPAVASSMTGHPSMM